MIKSKLHRHNNRLTITNNKIGKLQQYTVINHNKSYMNTLCLSQSILWCCIHTLLLVMLGDNEMPA